MTTPRDKLEIWHGKNCLQTIPSAHAPDRGDMIVILDEVYDVIGRSYTVDYPRDYHQRGVTCLLMVEPTTKTVDRFPR